MNEKWIIWILASIFDHFKDNANQLIIPTQEQPPSLNPNRFELMFIGPDFDLLTITETRATITLNLLCISNQDPNNIYFHYRWLGKGIAKFSKCIPVYKYATNDDNSLIGNLLLDTDLKLTNILPIDPVSRQQRGTIEAQYSMLLEP